MLLAAGVQWQSPQMLGVALLVGVLVVLAVGMLYPGQTRVLPGVWRVVLPGLRAAALVALAVSVARPVARRALAEEEQGAVVVLIDKSLSMDVRDTQRSHAMYVALADGLGRIEPGQRSRGETFQTIAPDIDRLPGLVGAINQSQVELAVAQLQGKQNPEAKRRFEDGAAEFARVSKALAGAQAKLSKAPAMAKALAALGKLPAVDSAEWGVEVGPAIAEVARRAAQYQTDSDDALYRSKPQVKAVCDELAGLTRFQLVERALADPQAGLLARLPARAPLFGYAIGENAAAVPLRGGGGGGGGGQNVRRLLVEPDAARSDLTGGLREVMNLLRYQPVQSVILFSDGRQVGAEASIASSLMGSGVPVYTVSPAPSGSGSTVRDVWVERVTMPQSLFVGETLNVSVELRWSGFQGKSPEVTLEAGGERQRKVAKVADAKATTATVNFALPMNEGGPHRVTVSVTPLDGEISAENNVATRWVKVLSDKFDVLLVGGSASWDFRYLRNALSRTQWVNAQSVLLDREGSNLGLPVGQILGQDVIVLCDAPAKGLRPEQWEAVRKVVAQRGGSVILIAGQAHVPREYTGEFLSEFLPYRRSSARGGATGGAVWRTWPGEEPEFRVVPAAGAAAGADALGLDDNPERSAERWMTLPPVFRFLALPELKEVAQPLLVERGGGAPVLTRQRLGRGKVFFLGVDETWRWRNKVGERDQDRFFQQLVRAAADEPYAAANNFLSLDTDRVTVAPGESVRVRARLADPSSSQQADGSGLDVDVVRDGAVVRTQRLGPVGEADSGRYEGSVGGLGAGEYVLRLRGPEGSELEYPLHVIRSVEAELANLSPDEALLKRLASSSGGEFRTLEQLKDLPLRLSSLREREPKTAEFRIWSSWYLYAFVVACLGAEWALRKRLGLS